MAERARELSLLFAPEDVRYVPEGFGRTLASHLTGQRLETGDRVALPGWPAATVEAIEPAGAEVGPGTELTVNLPPEHGTGATSVVMLVDASLTMGQGEVGAFEEAARAIDGFLLNGRSFLAQAGIVVQGGSTRERGEPAPPEDLTGASILKVEPRGTFDLDAGLEQALGMLEDAPAGPQAIVVFTDGDDPPEDPLTTARPVLHAGVTLFAVTPNVRPFAELCSYSGGHAAEEPGPVFEALAELAGSQARWEPPRHPGPDADDEEYEFEVVIEAMEGQR